MFAEHCQHLWSYLLTLFMSYILPLFFLLFSKHVYIYNIMYPEENHLSTKCTNNVRMRIPLPPMYRLCFFYFFILLSFVWVRIVTSCSRGLFFLAMNTNSPICVFSQTDRVQQFWETVTMLFVKVKQHLFPWSYQMRSQQSDNLCFMR